MEFTHRKRKLLLTTLALGMLLNPLNSTMISVALSRIQIDFDLSLRDVTWIITIFYVTSAVAQPIIGKISDTFGRKRMFILGLILVTFSCMLAPFSPNFGWLLFFRFIQALGTSAIMPSGMGIARKYMNENQARALGILTIATSATAAVGPFIGGLLIHYNDWQAIFFINFPFIIASYWLCMKVIPADSPSEQVRQKTDFLGLFLFLLLTVLWYLFLFSLSKINWWLFAFATAISYSFYKYEEKQKQPFIDVVFLKKNINVTIIYASFILVNFSYFSVIFGVPIYLQNFRGLDAHIAGMIILAVSGFAVLITPITARWLEKVGSKKPSIFGTSLGIVGTLLIYTVNDSSSNLSIFLILSIIGTSTGINFLCMQTGLYTFVSKQDTGLAYGLLSTSRFMGTILCSSSLAILYATEVTTVQLHWLALSCAISGGLVLLLYIRLPLMK